MLRLIFATLTLLLIAAAPQGPAPVICACDNPITPNP